MREGNTIVTSLSLSRFIRTKTLFSSCSYLIVLPSKQREGAGVTNNFVLEVNFGNEPTIVIDS